jgi:hypothetical protein
LALAGALTLLAFSSDGASRLLTALVAVALAFRARHHRRTWEVVPLLATALAGLAALEVGLILGARDAGLQSRLLLLVPASALLLLLLGVWLRRPASPAHARRRLRWLELATHLAIVPVALVPLGVYRVAAELGRRLG